MTIQSIYEHVKKELLSIYDEREAANIAAMVIEKITGKTKTDRIINKAFPINHEQEKQIEEILADLLENKPVQYALQEAWFMGMCFFVNEHVLIPRPETEELVLCVLTELKKNNAPHPCIIDIGTGSGCISVAIKKNYPDARVSAIDISENALQVAEKNANHLKTEIHFLKGDILDENSWSLFEKFDYIISNPPYIKQSEKAEMRKNVLNYEPHLALFVADDNAMLFYDKIAKFALQHLKENGKIVVEINETLSAEVSDTFKNYGYQDIIVLKDLQQKDRIVIAGKSVGY